MNFLSESGFLHFVVPLITVFLSVSLKIISRNDKFMEFRKEDLAIGLDVAATALILLTVESANVARQLVSQPPPAISVLSGKLIEAPWIMLVFVIIIVSVSTVVRLKGWKDRKTMNWIPGIIVPNVFGIGLLLFVVFWIR